MMQQWKQVCWEKTTNARTKKVHWLMCLSSFCVVVAATIVEKHILIFDL